MDSPYQPGFGARPAVLVGRDQQLARAAASLTRVANSRAAAPSAMILTGTRGLGKTVTLGVIADAAVERGFITVSVAFDSVSDNVRLLAGLVAEAVAPLGRRRVSDAWSRMRHRLAGLAIEINAGVVKIGSPAAPSAAYDSQTATVQRQGLAGLMIAAAQIAAETGSSGVVILIDEFQEAPKSQLVVVANAIQDALAASGQVPIVFFAAGLPQTPERVMAAASFTERFDFRVLDRLDRSAAERALVEPALQLGVRWDPAAVDAVTEAANGSPFLIQLLGDEAWTAASPNNGSIITDQHAGMALEEVQRGLAVGMFRGRWIKATKVEKELIVAIAQVVTEDGVALTRHITALLGKTTPQLSTARKALIDKGLIESVGTGQLRFTMPGFAAFVRTHVDAEWVAPHLYLDDITDLKISNRPSPRELPGGQQSPGESPHR